MLDKNATSTCAAVDRIFRGHVVAVVLTGAIMFMLLVGDNKVPQVLALSLCAVAVCSLIAFPYMIIGKKPHRRDYVAVSLGLSLAQLTFVLSVMACYLAPAVNFKSMLFG